MTNTDNYTFRDQLEAARDFATDEERRAYQALDTSVDRYFFYDEFISRAYKARVFLSPAAAHIALSEEV